MNGVHPCEEKSKNSRELLLALHSCTDTLGIATFDYKNKFNLKTFPIARKLSNKIFSCIEELLPSEEWKDIKRISVSLGPGSFTSTRISIAIARTIAQQLQNCNVDGISSFELMAPRLAKQLNKKEKRKPFWIRKDLPKRGFIAGKYQIDLSSDNFASELVKPSLFDKSSTLNPIIFAKENVEADVQRLLEISIKRHKEQQMSPWEKILPIYPISPVSNTQ